MFYKIYCISLNKIREELNRKLTFTDSDAWMKSLNLYELKKIEFISNLLAFKINNQ